MLILNVVLLGATVGDTGGDLSSVVLAGIGFGAGLYKHSDLILVRTGLVYPSGHLEQLPAIPHVPLPQRHS